jgi:hypothetical protein
MVIIAFIDYFSMGKVKPMIFMQNVIGYCGFFPEEFASQDTLLLSFMLNLVSKYCRLGYIDPFVFGSGVSIIEDYSFLQVIH